MTVLSRYLIRHNIFLLLAILLISTGIYLLTDLFDRLDNFVDAGVSVSLMALYFAIKVPLIISQLLPAVFLIAMVVQLNLLDKSRELVALRAGGISPLILLRFIVIYGCFWAAMQFVFSQIVGVEGDRIATQIWKGDVRGDDLNRRIFGIWLTDKNRIIHLGMLIPNQGIGEDVRIYELDQAGTSILRIIEAKNFTVEEKKWSLANVKLVDPERAVVNMSPTFDFAIKQDLKAFRMIDSKARPEQLPPWELQKVINRLKKAGSNVEGLVTALHSKFAYALSIVVMGLFALAITQVTPNLYKAIGGSLVLVFIFHTVNTFCLSFGENGLLNPIVSAWFANVAMFILLGMWFLWPVVYRKLTK